MAKFLRLLAQRVWMTAKTLFCLSPSPANGDSDTNEVRQVIEDAGNQTNAVNLNATENGVTNSGGPIQITISRTPPSESSQATESPLVPAQNGTVHEEDKNSVTPDPSDTASFGPPPRAHGPGALSRGGSTRSIGSGQSSPGQTAGNNYKLCDMLEQAFICAESRRFDKFIPLSILLSLIVVDAVVADLQAQDPRMDDLTAQQFAEAVCRGDGKGAQQIYAILALMKRGFDIVGLLQEDVHDADLPLANIKVDGDVALIKRGGQAIQTFATWGKALVHDFDQKQFQVNSPFLHEGKHHDFDEDAIGPFIPLKPEEQTIKTLEGGYSKVYPRRIKPGQHDFWPLKSEDEEPLVAVKELYSAEHGEFQRERGILEELGPKNHPNLIKLLATFKHNERYHLVFPYADANLRTYWKKNATPDINAQTVFWTLAQIRGISDGLQLVHNFKLPSPVPVPNPKELAVPVSLGVTEEEEKYGRHGDIKPENILWFAESKDHPLMGILKIADFGLGRFHGRDSRSNVQASTVNASPTYAPPELKLLLSVTRGYDIWSLGCLFLEFFTWLLEGFGKIEEFSEFRGVFNTSTKIDDDNFFTIITGGPDGSTAVVRHEVEQWVARLHENEKCSQLIHDLLDLTMTSLLVVEAKDRINSADLTSRLTELLEDATKDPEYMLKPAPRLADTLLSVSNGLPAPDMGSIGPPITFTFSPAITMDRTPPLIRTLSRAYRTWPDGTTTEFRS